MGINVRDELIDEIIKQASRQTGNVNYFSNISN